jgi:hypothetical protein
MANIKEIDPIADFKLTLDQFYDLVKVQLGNLQVDSFIQLQATAIPLDVSLDYYWFSLGVLNSFFDVRLEPFPIDETLGLGLKANALFSREYISFLSELIRLVEVKALDSDTLQKIDELQIRVAQNRERIRALISLRTQDWLDYCAGTLTEAGNISILQQWSEGQPSTRELFDLQQESNQDQALISALRLRRYEDADDQAIVDAWAAATAPASRFRYPRFEDTKYGEETPKFNAVYFAKLPDNDGTQFRSLQLATPLVSLTKIAQGDGLGNISSTISKQSQSNSKITTDWKVSGSGRAGLFRSYKFTAEAAEEKTIEEDFKNVESITVGAKYLLAIPIRNDWFDAGIFNNRRVKENRDLFERYIGEKGTLLYTPTNLIVARGFNLKFSSSQDWKYDYESKFSSSGTSQMKIFGINFGKPVNASYNEKQKQQKVERRGNDLSLDDGDNIRILGYVVSKNVVSEAFGLLADDLSDRFL